MEEGEKFEFLRAGEAAILIDCLVSFKDMTITCGAAWLNPRKAERLTLRKADKSRFVELLIPEGLSESAVVLGDGGGELIKFNFRHLPV